MKEVCPNCETFSEVELINESTTIDIRGESIEVPVEYYKCKSCKEEFERSTSDIKPVEEAFRIYRNKHDLPQPEEIISFRKKYSLTQGELSRLLGWSVATLSRYENGALPDEAHEKSLQLAMNPRNLIILLHRALHVFDSERFKYLKELITSKVEEEYDLECDFKERYGQYEPDIYSGYKILDINKLINAILYFCTEGLYTTVINKLLFYSDFGHFKDFTVSITGVRYAHMPFGPAPDKYSSLLSMLVDSDILCTEEDESGSGVRYYTNTKHDLSIFSDSEIITLATIKENFKLYSARELSDISHNEDGYKETSDGEIISYSFAEELIGIN